MESEEDLEFRLRQKCDEVRYVCVYVCTVFECVCTWYGVQMHMHVQKPLLLCNDKMISFISLHPIISFLLIILGSDKIIFPSHLNTTIIYFTLILLRVLERELQDADEHRQTLERQLEKEHSENKELR